METIGKLKWDLLHPPYVQKWVKPNEKLLRIGNKTVAKTLEKKCTEANGDYFEG